MYGTLQVYSIRLNTLLKNNNSNEAPVQAIDSFDSLYDEKDIEVLCF